MFISNEDIDDIIAIIKSLEDSGVLIDVVTETVKDEIKKQEGGFLDAVLSPLAPLLVQPTIFSVVKGITGREVRRAETGYNNMDHVDKKNLVLLHSLSNIKITNHFNCEHKFNGIFSKDNLYRIKSGTYVINLDEKK